MTEIGIPYTLYTVQVRSNIKGNLQLNAPIERERSISIYDTGKGDQLICKIFICIL